MPNLLNSVNLKDKKVLITGGSGFIGSHLLKKVMQLGANVSTTVKYKSIIDNVRLASVWDDIDIYECDLRNVDSFRQFAGKKFDIVFHLAAYNHVGDSFLHVNEALQSNTIATANLIEVGPLFDRFVYISSSESYGLQDNVPWDEVDTPFPISPYAVGKYSGELYCRMKQRQTQLPIICVRPFNAFGPYQSEKAVIPELIIKCIRGVPVETTKGLQTREFNFVINLVEGMILASQKPAFTEVVNIGSGEEISIAELAAKIHAVTNSKSELKIGSLPDRPTEIMRMAAKNERAKNILAWSPSTPFNDGLKVTVEWFRTFVETFYNQTSPISKLAAPINQ